MDVFARGLRNASKIIADGCLDEAKDVSNHFILNRSVFTRQGYS